MEAVRKFAGEVRLKHTTARHLDETLECWMMVCYGNIEKMD